VGLVAETVGLGVVGEKWGRGNQIEAINHNMEGKGLARASHKENQSWLQDRSSLYNQTHTGFFWDNTFLSSLLPDQVALLIQPQSDSLTIPARHPMGRGAEEAVKWEKAMRAGKRSGEAGGRNLGLVGCGPIGERGGLEEKGPVGGHWHLLQSSYPLLPNCKRLIVTFSHDLYIIFGTVQELMRNNPDASQS
jgi:hypothetical protein